MNPRKQPCICGSGLEFRKCCEKKNKKTFSKGPSLSNAQIMDKISVLNEDVFHLCMGKLDDSLEKMVDDFENEVKQLVQKVLTTDGKKVLQRILTKVPDLMSRQKIQYIYVNEFPKAMVRTLLDIITQINTQKQDNYQNALPKIEFDSDFSTPEHKFEIQEGFVKYTGNDAFVNIPEKIGNETVIGIASDAFSNSTALQAVKLPHTITHIARNGFTDCTSLVHVKFNEGLIEIGKHAFNGCHSLTSLVLPESLQVIDSYAFNECKRLVRVHFPQTLAHIGAFAFSETALRYVELPSGLQFIANAVFSDCTELEFVRIPEAVEGINMHSFSNCGALRHIVLPKTLKTIHASAFVNCYHVKQLLIPSRIEEISPSSFTDLNPNVQIYSTLSKTMPIAISNMFPIPQNNEVKTKALKTFFESKNWNTLTEEQYLEKEKQLLAEVQHMYHVILGIKQPKGPSIETQFMALLDKGIAQKRAGQYEQSKQSYIEAIRLIPSRSVTYFNLGKVLYILGDYKAAAKSYRTALEHEHEVEETIYHLGHALLDETVSATETHLVKSYLQRVAPAKTLKFKQPTTDEVNAYDKKCVEAATEFINSLV